MQYVGKIDPNIYKVIEPIIQETQVVITERQIQHIKDRHPSDYEKFSIYLPQIIADPDYILEANRPHTAFILKSFESGGHQFEVILRLKALEDPEGYYNSIITFLKVDKKRYERYLRTKKILYKKE